MEIPDKLREIVDQLGVALVRALANDESSRALVQEVQAFGFDMALMLEATVALHKREPAPEDGAAEPEAQDEEAESSFTLNDEGVQWSEEDRAFLKTFKISLE